MIDRFLAGIVNARSFLAKLWALARPYWFAQERQHLGLWGYQRRRSRRRGSRAACWR